MRKRNYILRILSVVVIIVCLVLLYRIYSKYNYNDYIKAEYNLGKTEFTRDLSEKYSKTNSYKLENTDFNDAMFYKTIEVTPNTPYKVTCMIKTQDVINENENTDAGAHICISDTTEKSDNVVGTTDWKKIEFMFNSRNRTSVELGFRLGGYSDNTKGIAWFSDITIESGILEESNEWNYLCLVFDNVNVNVKNNNLKLQLTNSDIEDMKLCVQRFKNSLNELSLGKIKVSYDMYEITEPITSMSHDEENGYYVSPLNIQSVLDEYVAQSRYDHIYAIFRTGDAENQIIDNDWIGLGGMEYRNIGFSNIRLPNNDNSYIYKYDYRVNTFPEEVFIHEFLHTLERNAKDYNYEIPELHDNEKYGYKVQKLTGLKQWYSDYMNKNIQTTNGKIGLPKEIFDKKPVNEDCFEYSHKIDEFKEPQNIIEEINSLIKKLCNK